MLENGETSHVAKLKRLLPTLRERKRYVVFDILSERQITQAHNVQEAIEQALLTYAGTRGVASAGMLFIKDAYAHNKGIVRVNHNEVDTLKSALMFVTHIDDEEVAMQSVKTSGTLQKARGG